MNYIWKKWVRHLTFDMRFVIKSREYVHEVCCGSVAMKQSIMLWMGVAKQLELEAYTLVPHVPTACKYWSTIETTIISLFDWSLSLNQALIGFENIKDKVSKTSEKDLQWN